MTSYFGIILLNLIKFILYLNLNYLKNKYIKNYSIENSKIVSFYIF